MIGGNILCFNTFKKINTNILKDMVYNSENEHIFVLNILHLNLGLE
jgi:hypothetical protein